MGAGGVRHYRREIDMIFVTFRQVEYSGGRLRASHTNSESNSGFAVKQAPSLQCDAEI